MPYPIDPQISSLGNPKAFLRLLVYELPEAVLAPLRGEESMASRCCGRSSMTPWGYPKSWLVYFMENRIQNG